MDNGNVPLYLHTQSSSNSENNDENELLILCKPRGSEQEQKCPPTPLRRLPVPQLPLTNIQRQFALANRYPESVISGRKWAPRKSDRLYFFYGTLMDSKLLASILGLKSDPQLKPAKVIGFRIKLWGSFPAMIQAHGQTLHGVAYEIASDQEVENQVAKLQTYETSRYRRYPVIVRYEDGTRPAGWAFLWDGDEKVLQEGEFDLEAWRTEFHNRQKAQSNHQSRL